MFGMCLASLLFAVLAACLLWRVASDQPQGLLWTFALLACPYLFLWTITLSEGMSVCTVFFRVSYVPLLAFAAVHLIGPVNGMIVMYSGMIYIAGMLGYAVAEHLQRIGIEQTANALFTPCFINKDSHDSVCFVRFYLAVMSLPVLVRMAWVVFVPDNKHRTLLDATEVVLELAWEIVMLHFIWITYVTEIVLRGALVSLETFSLRAMLYFSACFWLGMFLLFAVTKAVGMLCIWLGLMGMGGFFGYSLAISARYNQILAGNQGLKRKLLDYNLSQELDERDQKPGLHLLVPEAS